MKSTIAIFLSASLFALAGCNTVAGFGKDVEKVGEKTQETSKEVSKDIKTKK